MKILRWLLGLGIGLALAGCGLFGGAEKDIPLPTNEPGPPKLVVTLPPGVELVECPFDSDLYLKFSANFTLEQGEFKVAHLLEDGVLSLWLDADGIIRALEPPQIPYSISGSAGECTIQGQGSMTPGASGYCAEGVVHLIITESWAQGEATMQCEDRISSVTLPSPGSLTHSGPDGRGEIFYLDKNFTEEGIGAGYTQMRPFLMGSGEHIWTLYMPEIPVVPIVE